jgi:Na+-driven multidrug efflux pump
MGGGVSSAIARALGGGRLAEAQSVALHALVIALACGGSFTLVLLPFGPALWRALGGEGVALAEATSYSTILFAGAAGAWVLSTLAAILRGAGDIVAPARIGFCCAAAVLPLSWVLIRGIGPFPGFGLAGAAMGTLTYYAVGIAAMSVRLGSARSALRLSLSGLPLRRRHFADILRVGGISSLQIAQGNLLLVAVTGFVGAYGADALAGFGIAARLEFFLGSIGFALGAAATTMIGTSLGAGRPERARRVTWTAAAIGAGIYEAIGLLVAFMPGLWLGFFSVAPEVEAAGAAYLRVIGPTYAAVALLSVLFFASQGWGRMAMPFLTSFLRLVLALVAGWLVVRAGGGLLALFLSGAVATLAAAAALVVLIWRRTRAVKPP